MKEKRKYLKLLALFMLLVATTVCENLELREMVKLLGTERGWKGSEKC